MSAFDWPWQDSRRFDTPAHLEVRTNSSKYSGAAIDEWKQNETAYGVSTILSRNDVIAPSHESQ